VTHDLFNVKGKYLFVLKGERGKGENWTLTQVSIPSVGCFTNALKWDQKVIHKWRRGGEGREG